MGWRSRGSRAKDTFRRATRGPTSIKRDDLSHARKNRALTANMGAVLPGDQAQPVEVSGVTTATHSGLAWSSAIGEQSSGWFLQRLSKVFSFASLTATKKGAERPSTEICVSNAEAQDVLGECADVHNLPTLADPSRDRDEISDQTPTVSTAYALTRPQDTAQTVERAEENIPLVPASQLEKRAKQMMINSNSRSDAYLSNDFPNEIGGSSNSESMPGAKLKLYPRPPESKKQYPGFRRYELRPVAESAAAGEKQIRPQLSSIYRC